MTRLLFATALLLGTAAIVWMCAGFIGSNTLAFTITSVIGAAYLTGIIELLRFGRATASLTTALTDIPARTDDPRQWLEHWLQRLDPSLQAATRLRIEGERVGLPAPVLTPYLVGLLVMLGLLGTFAGMVDTLAGAVVALQGSTELEAIRAGLAAPIQGLSVAFGTSVAGVAASAMLGLSSTLVRRERMLATRQLEGRIATDFREFSLGYQRQEAYRALHSQSQSLPVVADKLQAVAAQLAQMGEQLGETLVANQTLFHDTTASRYTELAASVDQSLRESLAASGLAAGESIKPVITQAMARISELAQDTHQTLQHTAQQQLESFGNEFRTAGTTLLSTFDTAASAWVEKSLALQDSISRSVTESTRAAAEIDAQLRAAMSNNIERDNGLLEERQQLMSKLNALTTSLERASHSQLEAVAQLINTSAGTLQQVSVRFGDQVETEVSKMAEASTNLAAGATEISSLGEAFGAAVEQFSSANETLVEHLTRVEAAMSRTSNRSDEQMAYYVAQAREIIDQSMLSQQALLKDMRQLRTAEKPGKAQLRATEAG